jgi:hypothetical protein
MTQTLYAHMNKKKKAKKKKPNKMEHLVPQLHKHFKCSTASSRIDINQSLKWRTI